MSSILVLSAIGVYFAINSSSQIDMGGMMGDGANPYAWIISAIMLGAAAIIAVGLVLYFVYPKKTQSMEKQENTVARSAELDNTEEKLLDIPIQTKMQKIKGRIATGNKNLDKLLYGGIPPNFAVALTAPSSDEANSLIKTFIETGSKNSETTFFVTVDPSLGRDIARKFPLNFYLFICNAQIDPSLKISNVFTLSGIDNLTEISIALKQAVRKLDISHKGPRRICVNIVSDVLLQHGAVIARKWLAELIAALSSDGFTILAVINPQMHSSEDLHALLGLFQGEISIRETETVKELKRYLKIKRMSNKKYLKNEILLTEY